MQWQTFSRKYQKVRYSKAWHNKYLRLRGTKSQTASRFALSVIAAWPASLIIVYRLACDCSVASESNHSLPSCVCSASLRGDYFIYQRGPTALYVCVFWISVLSSVGSVMTSESIAFARGLLHIPAWSDRGICSFVLSGQRGQ